MPDFSVIVSALITAAVMPFILNKLSGDKHPPASSNGFHLLEYGKTAKVATYICSIFFFALAFLAYRFPGKTDPAQLPWAIALFLAAALLGVFTCWFMHKAKVRWNDDLVSGTDLLGRMHNIAWADLSNIEYVAWAQGFRLSTKGNSCIWVFPMMLGFNAFMKKLEQEGNRLGLAIQPEEPPDKND